MLVEVLLNLIIGLIRMRIKKTYILFFCTLFILVTSKLNGQNYNINNEKIELLTDRTLYISGENIQFSVYLFNSKLNNISTPIINSFDNLDAHNMSVQNKKTNISKIVYVELISPDGEKVYGGKFLVENSISSGCIAIPKETITGNYYVRAYTKFMRNSGASAYKYLAIKIVNPSKEYVLKYDLTRGNLSDTLKSEDSLLNRNLITISLDKNEYSTREKVHLIIKGLGLKDKSLRYLNIAVIPEFTYTERTVSQPKAENVGSKLFYYPEIKSVSLTGRIKNKSNISKSNTTINLSILGNQKDFMATKTDSSGRFYFNIPNFKGIRNVFLCTEENADNKSTIFIDNDFCQNKVKIPTPAFQLNDIEKSVALKLAQSVQIASNFEKKVQPDSSTLIEPPFYGEPQIKVDFSYYIQLPTIEDYINELIPMLKIKKQQGKKYFKIIMSENDEMDIYKPLVLLDMVAIDNTEKILSLSTQKISRIEIVNTPYIKGNFTFGGIISIFSKKGDFANIDLPSSGIFLDYKFLSNCENSNTSINDSNNFPDTRNTLLWNPNIPINPDSNEVEFKTSDIQGKYIVLLRVINSKGRVLTYKSSLVVKQN